MNAIKMILALLVLFAIVPGDSRSQEKDPQTIDSKPATTKLDSDKAPSQASPELDKQEKAKEPDPLKLLEAVAVERSKLPASSMTMDLKLVVQNRNFHAICNVDYSAGNYRFFGTAADADKVSIFNGTEVLTYRRGSANLLAPDKSPGQYLFDPQSFGLTAKLFPNQAPRKVLAFYNAKSVALDGTEKINGIQCWKVKVLAANGQTLTYWINEKEQHRVYKMHYEFGETRREVLCEYDKNIAEGIIPRRVKTQEWLGKEKLMARDTTIMSFEKSEFVDNDFNLFGLGMKVGTPVTDIRIHKRIGYWDGQKLTEHLPKNDQ